MSSKGKTPQYATHSLVFIASFGFAICKVQLGQRVLKRLILKKLTAHTRNPFTFRTLSQYLVNFQNSHIFHLPFSKFQFVHSCFLSHHQKHPLGLRAHNLKKRKRHSFILVMLRAENLHRRSGSHYGGAHQMSQRETLQSSCHFCTLMSSCRCSLFLTLGGRKKKTQAAVS